MLRRFALPEDKVPCPSDGIDIGAGNSRRSGIVVKNRRTGCRETPCRPAVPRWHHRAPEVTSTTDAPAGSSSASRCSNPGPISLASTAVLAQILGAHGSLSRAATWLPAASRSGEVFCLSVWAMTRLSFRLPTIAARRQMNRAISARSHIENGLEGRYRSY